MSSVATRLAKEAAQKRQLEEDEKVEAAQAALEPAVEPAEDADASDDADDQDLDEDGLGELLAALPNGPTTDQVEAWRKTYNSVYALSLRDDDWYIWRYLKLGEWKNIQSLAGTVTPDLVEEFYKAQVLKYCLIWPREKVLDPVKAQELPANLLNLLYEVVMSGSYFMPAEQALRQTIRL